MAGETSAIRGKGMKRFCMSIGLDYLENQINQGKVPEYLSTGDRQPTLEECKDAIVAARAKGYVVLSACDNVTTTGHCAGHSEGHPKITDTERLDWIEKNFCDIGFDDDGNVVNTVWFDKETEIFTRNTFHNKTLRQVIDFLIKNTEQGKKS